MKKRIIGLVAIGAVAATGYLFWQQQMSVHEQALENMVASYNAAEGETLLDFSYESKQTSGFPLATKVTYVNPRLRISDTFYQTLESEHKSLNFTKRVQEVRLDGNLSTRNQLLDNVVSLVMEGTQYHHVISNDQISEETPAVVYETTWDGVATCDLATAHAWSSSHMRDMKTVADAVRALERFQCESHNQVTRDQATSDVISEIGYSMFEVTSDKAEGKGRQRVGLSVQIDDAYIMPLGQDMKEDITLLLQELGAKDASIAEALAQYPLPAQPLSGDAKSDVVIKGHYVGALEQGGEDSLEITMDTFSVKHPLYSLTMPFHMAYEPKGDVVIRTDTAFTMAEDYDIWIRDTMDTMLRIARHVSMDLDDGLRDGIENIDFDTVHGLVPAFHKAGTIKLMADVTGNIPQSTFTLGETGFRTDKYGMQLVGNVAPPYTTEGTLTCQSCGTMIQDLADYANNVAYVMHQLGEVPSPVIVSEPAVNTLISFLQSYDTDKVDGVLTIRAKNDDSGQVLISGKPMGMVMVRAFKELAPHFEAVMRQSGQIPPQ